MTPKKDRRASPPPTSQAPLGKTQPTSKDAELMSMICEAMESKLEPVVGKLDRVMEHLANNEKCLDEAEKQIHYFEVQLAEVSSKMDQVEKTALSNKNKNQDLEDRGRRKNICLVGLEEQEPVGSIQCASFIQSWFQTHLKLEKEPRVERAHRMGRIPDVKSSQIRPLICRFNDFYEKEEVIRPYRGCRKEILDPNKNIYLSGLFIYL